MSIINNLIDYYGENIILISSLIEQIKKIIYDMNNVKTYRSIKNRLDRVINITTKLSDLFFLIQYGKENIGKKKSYNYYRFIDVDIDYLLLFRSTVYNKNHVPYFLWDYDDSGEILKELEFKSKNEYERRQDIEYLSNRFMYLLRKFIRSVNFYIPELEIEFAKKLNVFVGRLLMFIRFEQDYYKSKQVLKEKRFKDVINFLEDDMNIDFDSIKKYDTLSYFFELCDLEYNIKNRYFSKIPLKDIYDRILTIYNKRR